MAFVFIFLSIIFSQKNLPEKQLRCFVIFPWSCLPCDLNSFCAQFICCDETEMMRGMFLLLLTGLYLFPTCKAQYYRFKHYYEPDLLFGFGSGAGSMHALTDLGGRRGPGKSFIKDINTGYSRLCYSIYFLALYRNTIGLKLEYTQGSVYAADEVLAPVAPGTFGRYDRNLSFRSRISELLLGCEFHLPAPARDVYANPRGLSPYLLFAVGYFNFAPQAKWNGQWYALQPLHTEGQGFDEYPGRKAYALSQPVIAAGSGLRWRFSEQLAGRFEITHRFLRTDYLDDVSTTYIDPVLFSKYLVPDKAHIARNLYSRKKERNPSATTTAGDQRGHPGNKDSYFTVMIKLGYMPLRKMKR